MQETLTEKQREECENHSKKIKIKFNSLYANSLKNYLSSQIERLPDSDKKSSFKKIFTSIQDQVLYTPENIDIHKEIKEIRKVAKIHRDNGFFSQIYHFFNPKTKSLKKLDKIIEKNDEKAWTIK